jgi:hypothetical protein
VALVAREHLFINAHGSWCWKDGADAVLLASYLRPEQLNRPRSFGEAIKRDFPALLDRIGDWPDFRHPIEPALLPLLAGWTT